MVRSRVELSKKLRLILGNNHCYFSPPTGMQMMYPCIVYDLSNVSLEKADNINYKKMRQWTIIVIDKNPDSVIFEDVMEAFPYCTYDRHYVADGLNHTVLSLYY